MELGLQDVYCIKHPFIIVLAGQLSAFRSPVRLSSKTRTGLSASSPSKRVRETGSVSAADGVPKLERFDFIEFDSPTKKEKRRYVRQGSAHSLMQT